jgi:hypothetical protein
MKISRKVSFILFFSFSFPALGQKSIYGRILDSLSLKPVSYATVSTLSTSIYCDSLGYFKVSNIQDNYLIISCVGYNTKMVNIHYDQCDTISLSPIFKELDPVTVRKPDFLNNKKIQLKCQAQCKCTSGTCASGCLAFGTANSYCTGLLNVKPLII